MNIPISKNFPGRPVAIFCRDPHIHRRSRQTRQTTPPVEAHGQVVWRLASHWDNHAPGILQLADVHDPLLGGWDWELHQWDYSGLMGF